MNDEQFDALCEANSFGAVARGEFQLVPRALLKALVDAAVAAERERCSVVTNAMVRAANAAMFGKPVLGDARFETLRLGLEAAMAARTEAQG
jgi:hypothetical protein